MEIRLAAVIRASAAILSAFFIASTAGAASLAQFNVSQVVADPPKIKVYLDVEGGSAGRPTHLEARQLAASVGQNVAQVSGINLFASTGEGVASIFLVDISKSLSRPQFASMRQAISLMIDSMGSADYAAIITFGGAVKLAKDFTQDKAALKSVISGLGPTDNITRLHEGLSKALDLGRSVQANLPSRRAIIVLSDGQDDVIGGMTMREVMERIEENPVPIYSIGFYNPPRSAAKENRLKALGEFAHVSGGLYFGAGSASFGKIFKKVREKIIGVEVVSLLCESCVADGRVYRVQLSYSIDGQAITSGRDVRILPHLAPSIPGGVTPDTPGIGTGTAPGDARSVTSAASNSDGKGTIGRQLYEWKWAILLVVALLATVSIIFFKRIQAGRQGAQAAVSDYAGPSHPRPPSELQEFSAPDRPSINITLTEIGTKKDRKTYRHKLSYAVVLGRSRSKSDIVVENDDEISARHCQLSLEERSVALEDLGSSNGTSVNGIPIYGKHRINDGDVILIGRTELRISLNISEDK